MSPAQLLDETTLTETADLAATLGRLDEALRLYVRLLRVDPRNYYVAYRTASLLGRVGDSQVAAATLELSAQRLAQGGQLMLALSASNELHGLSPLRGRAVMEQIAALYAAGSPRVDRRHRPPPPPPPMPDQVPLESADAEAPSDPRALRELAADVCAETLQRASADPLPQASVPFHPLLSDLRPTDFVELVSLLQLRSAGPDEVVVKQGSEGRSLFLVARGMVRVSLSPPDGEELTLAYLRAGAFFGEMALLTESPRAASVTCQTPTLLLEVSRAELEELAARNPSVAQVLANYTRVRLLRNVMATSPLFLPLDPSRRERLIELFEMQVFGPGEIVLREGEPSDGLHVVLSGAVGVSKLDGEEELSLAELGAGQIFGEISLIQRRPATATVRALCKTALLRLSRVVFDEHVADFPEVVAHVYRVAVDREEQNLALQRSQLVPVGEELLLI